MKMTVRQKLTFGIAAVGAALAGTLGFTNLSHDTPASEPPAVTVLPVETTELVPVQSYARRRTFTGVLKASRTSDLGFERTGRLVAIEVDEGAHVEAGQVLARLDTDKLVAKQQELTAQRDAAASLLRELEAGPRRQTIEVARAEVRELQSQVELADRNFRRRAQLLKSNATSREDFDSASLGLESIRARSNAAQCRLDELEAGTRPEQIAAQRASVAQLDAALLNIEVELEDSVLKAPFSGTIGQRYPDEGAIVSPDAPLLRLVEDSCLEAWIGLPADVASRLRVGEATEIVVEQTRHPARVKSILPELTATTRTRTVIFALDEPGDAVPSQLARIDLDDTTETDGFWVPTSALARGSRGLWSVLVAEPTAAPDQFIAARRDVETLYTDGTRTLVRGTLKPGERVIIAASHRIVAGQLVSFTHHMAHRP